MKEGFKFFSYPLIINKKMRFNVMSNFLNAATSSQNRSLAFIESFKGLFTSSVCNLSSLSSAWYGLVGNKRGERYKVSMYWNLFVPSGQIYL